jgi:hypothetical protein
VLEGLPINQYREAEITIGPNTTEIKQLNQDDWPAPPMPRDFQLLPEHSQHILARARAPRIYKPPVPVEEDKEIMDEEEEHKEVRQGFTIKKWIKVPRHLEEPEPEYLAKRRKGLPSQYVNGATVTQPTPMRETKVKKTDAEGNVNVYKVLVPEGQAVEGEIQPTDAVTDAAIPAPGTVVEGVGVVNAEGVVVANDLLQQTPPRRRPPPPKKKKKSGPGRGKKKVLFAEGTTEQGTPISSTGSELLTVPGVKQEGSVEPSEGDDTPMPDAGDEDEGSGEEGSDDEDHDDNEVLDGHEEANRAPTLAQAIPTSTSSGLPVNVSVVEEADTRMSDVAPLVEAATEADLPNEVLASAVDTAATGHSEPSLQAPVQQQLEEISQREQSSSPELPLSTVSHSRQNSLNQLPPISALDTSTVPEPSALLEPSAIPAPSALEAAVQVVPEDTLNVVPEEKPNVVPEEKPNVVPEDAPNVVPEDAPNVVPEDAPNVVPEDAPKTMPEAMSEAPPQEVPDAIPTKEAMALVAVVEEATATPYAGNSTNAAPAPDSEPDLLGSLERQLEQDSETMGTN